MIIVGAGIIGLACAWRLAQKGIEVTVFDSGPAAGEASWAGAGMLAPGGECEADSPMSRMSVASLASYPEFVNELRDSSQLGIDFRICGGIELAFTPEEVEALADRANRQASAGIPSESIAWPASTAARFYPRDSVVDPREMTAALQVACQRLGVRVHEREAVTAIDPQGKSVQTTERQYSCEGVIVAAGAWSSLLLPAARRTNPVKGHLIGFDAKPGMLDTILRHRQTYLVQRSNGRLIAGTSVEDTGFDKAIDPHVVEDIRSRAAGLLPDLGALPVAEAWTGLRPAIEGEVPAIGRIICANGADRTNVWAAFGHYRNGILLAPETARQIAESVTAAKLQL